MTEIQVFENVALFVHDLTNVGGYGLNGLATRLHAHLRRPTAARVRLGRVRDPLVHQRELEKLRAVRVSGHRRDCSIVSLCERPIAARVESSAESALVGA